MPRKVITIAAGEEFSEPVNVSDVHAVAFFVEDYDGDWDGQYLGVWFCDTEDGEYQEITLSTYPATGSNE